jgi:hypothetical protein
MSYIFLYKLPVAQDHRDIYWHYYGSTSNIWIDYKYILKYICLPKKHKKCTKIYVKKCLVNSYQKPPGPSVIIRMYASFILSPFLIGTQNPHCGFMARFWLIRYYYYYYYFHHWYSIRAHRATVEIYRTQGQLPKSKSSFKLPFMINSQTCVLWVNLGMFSHYPGWSGSILQEAKEKSHKGPKWEESKGKRGRGHPTSLSSLPLQHWSVRLQRWEAEVRWSMRLEASREQERLGKGLWAQLQGSLLKEASRPWHWTG